MPKRIRYVSALPHESRGRLQYWAAPVLVFFALVFFDVLIGGAIAALLQIDGFTAVDQRLNEVYQFGYGLVIAAALTWLYLRTRKIAHVLAILTLLFGFVEDTLFYVLIPLCNPLISTLTGGATYQVKGGEFFPASISGWTGWASRRMLGQNTAFAMMNIAVINAIAVALAFGFLWWGRRATARAHERSRTLRG